jgi:hypothetical protein
MCKLVGLLVCAAFAGALGACTTNRVDIEGNETGGYASRMSANEGEVLNKANAHCAKWGRTAKITFISPEIGGNVTFICETPVPAPSATLPPSSPAPKRPPIPSAKQ